MKAALANFQSLPLKDAARQLLATLGYKSDKFIAGVGSSPQFRRSYTFLENIPLALCCQTCW